MASRDARRLLRALALGPGLPPPARAGAALPFVCARCATVLVAKDANSRGSARGQPRGQPRGQAVVSVDHSWRRTIMSEAPSARRRAATVPSLRRHAATAVMAKSEECRGPDTRVDEGRPDTHGPMQEYDQRVKDGRLRNDEHQRQVIENLQALHDMLAHYTPPKVKQPSLDSPRPRPPSFLGSLFGGGKKGFGHDATAQTPKGIYMYGDVGSGKTMMMDLFFDTLPPNITNKTRIHFHNFMQQVHRDLHKLKMSHGTDFDAIPFVAAQIAVQSSVLCFDEFQCTDVADAMILRRLCEKLMGHGVVMVTTSNRHPDDLYKNGIQRDSFIPCINLLKEKLRVINLDSETDYRKMPRPPSGVYHHPLDRSAEMHADKWFRYLGDFERDPPHRATHTVWGRDIDVPLASGTAARFSFAQLIGRATGAADYLELMRSYDAFIVTDVPGMDHKSRDWARRFITFIDAVYESRAKLVMTSAVPLTQLFLSQAEAAEATASGQSKGELPVSPSPPPPPTGPARNDDDHDDDHAGLSDAMRIIADDLGLSMAMLRHSSIFTGDEERFAFARALSRLTEMGTKDWVERGLGMESRGGRSEKASWQRVRSRWREDSL